MKTEHMFRWLCYLWLLVYVRSQLQCHPETLTYSYVNDIKLWGAIGQKFRLTLYVDIDCQGASPLPTPTQNTFDYVAHFYNVTVAQGEVRPEDAAKLCTVSKEPGVSCTVNVNSVRGEARESVTDMSDLFLLPVRITQTESGIVLGVQFMEDDFEHQDVMNMKKGVISSLQTKITGPGEVTDNETDSTGSHVSVFRSRKLGEKLVVEKEYKVNEDRSPTSRLSKMAEVWVKSQAEVEQGEIVDSKGEITTEMEEDDQSSEDDILSEDIASQIKIDEVVHSHSKFDLKLTTKTERSLSRQKRLAEYHRLTFLPTSLQMNSLNDNTESKFQQFNDLYDQIEEEGTFNIVKKYYKSRDPEVLKSLRSAIELETELGFEVIKGKLDVEGDPIIDRLIAATRTVINDCVKQWESCRDILELFTLGSGRKTEEVFEFLLSDRSTLNDENQVDVLNLVAFMANPSDKFILFLVHQITEVPEDSSILGALILTLGSLAGHKTVSENTKQVVRAIILKELETINSDDCSEDVRYADALEAIGNMGDIHFLDRLLEINMECRDSKVMRVALLHAIRNFLNDPRVQSLMIHTLSSFECDVSQDMVNLLTDEMQEQQLDEYQAENWPSTGFNHFDQALADSLQYRSPRLNCLRPEAIKYFRYKLSPVAHDIATSLESVIIKQNNGRNINKRGIKKHSSCTSWKDFKRRYKSIASASSFSSDSKRYNRKKHCLAHFAIGPSKASVNIYAGCFAGRGNQRKSKQGKLFAKIVAKGKVFKKSFSIGTVFLYATTSGNKVTGRIYAKMGKKTLIDKKIRKAVYKSTRKKFSAPSLKIPLAKIPIYITTINVDLKLSAAIVLSSHLRSCKNTDLCLTFTPKASTKATGTASVSLAVVKAGADLSLNLNYFVRGEGRVRYSKNPCVSLSHGHAENSVSLSFFYRIKSKVKVKLFPPKIKLKWGKKKTWKPSSLKWKISKNKEKKIFSNC